MPPRVFKPVKAHPLWLAVLLLSACLPGRSNRAPGAVVIRVEGSDTMVNIAQAWAEQYHRQHPQISVQVLGGGSGIGIASLIDGNCDLANTSREMTNDELSKAKSKHGVMPIEHIVGYDALGVYVHPKNPLASISLEQLAEIYGEDAQLTRWSQLGVPRGSLRRDDVVRVGRQNSSGTYEYFRHIILGKRRDFKLGSVDANGSKDVVALVAHTPSAIGYSGMGYQTPDVKMLPVAQRTGGAGVTPTLEHARDGTYPITRPLQIYTVGTLSPAVQAYLDWMVSEDGQALVRELGYVPLG